MAVDSEKLTPQEILKLSRIFFYGGFAFLPLLWILNFAWLWEPSRRIDAMPLTKHYVWYSLACSVIFIGGLVAWIVIYQIDRVDWGVTGDNLSMVIPLGSS